MQKRRGRPPKEGRSREETQQALLRAGTEAMTSNGFTASGLDQILKSVGVPKGSFYYYFSSKEAWEWRCLSGTTHSFAACWKNT
ncbi:TetR/AcrR family transcriptional regulator [Mangrovibacter sp. SLW1]